MGSAAGQERAGNSNEDFKVDGSRIWLLCKTARRSPKGSPSMTVAKCQRPGDVDAETTGFSIHASLSFVTGDALMESVGIEWVTTVKRPLCRDPLAPML
jgi:hypothetical protein